MRYNVGTVTEFYIKLVENELICCGDIRCSFMHEQLLLIIRITLENIWKCMQTYQINYSFYIVFFLCYLDLKLSN